MKALPELRSFWSPDTAPALLHAGGPCADLIRSMSWRETPLGPVESWDSSLTSALNLTLAARQPMFVVWGADRHLLHNDAFTPLLEGKRRCMGRPMHAVFPDAWARLGPLLDRALAGESVQLDDLPIQLERDGAAAKTWWSFGFSPVFSERGDVRGVLGVVHETTHRVVIDQTLSSDARRREIASAATNLLWSADVASRRVEGLNPRFRAAWALPSHGAPILWEDWVATLHPDDRGGVAGVLDRAAAGETVQSDFRATAPDGATRWFHATAFPIPDADGAIRRVAGVLVEVARTCEARVYLVGVNDGDALTRSLMLDGYKVRRFDGLAALLGVIDDLLAGVVVIGQHAGLDDPDTVTALKLNARRLPWIVAAPLRDPVSQVVQLMKHGAADVLAYGAPPEVVCAAVQALRPVEEKPARTAPSADALQRLAQLSVRERQVLDGLVAGGTNKAIAQSLSLSPRTVETYRAQLMDRLGIRSLAELLRLATEATPPTARH